MQSGPVTFDYHELIILETDQGKFKVKPHDLVQSAWNQGDESGARREWQQGRVVLPCGDLYLVEFLPPRKRKGHGTETMIEVDIHGIKKTSVHLVNWVANDKDINAAIAVPAF